VNINFSVEVQLNGNEDKINTVESTLRSPVPPNGGLSSLAPPIPKINNDSFTLQTLYIIIIEYIKHQGWSSRGVVPYF
jgi:hypothetical protein